MLANKLMSALSGEAEDKLYVDDVFSAYTYTGNGSTQTINNGIDLAGEGGLVWARARDSASGGHFLSDTVRGINNVLSSNGTSGNSAATYYTGVTSSGFGLSSNAVLNGTGGAGFGTSYISWTFRKAPKFFDVVTFTTGTDGVISFPHSLGSAPGMVVFKQTALNGSWYTWHRSLPNGTGLLLNSENQQSNFGFISANFTASTISVPASVIASSSGHAWVAYLFAHDPSADGIIQCGSFTGTPSSVTLGWEPQYLMIKRTDLSGDWNIYDTARNWVSSSGADSRLKANLANAEQSVDDYGGPNATGFNFRNEASGTYIYLAIRRPNKPPTTGTQVYNAIARTGTGAAATVTGVGFAPDFLIAKSRAAARSHLAQDRLRGVTAASYTDLLNQESEVTTAVTSFGMDGVSIGTSPSINSTAYGEPYINHFFRRARGFFDVVCYTGTGSATTVAHNLGVAPELMIVKNRATTSGYGHWFVGHKDIGSTYTLLLNGTQPKDDGWSGVFGNVFPTTSAFNVSGNTNVNENAVTYVAYLFATLPGISKVGSYTGNGTTQTINCGFTTGARFILIKRTNSAGDWYVWDTARGIVAGNDPHLSLNTTATEVTTNDSVDPDVSGFIVNQVAATNINVSGASYIFLSIA